LRFVAEENHVFIYVTMDGKKVYLTTDLDNTKITPERVLLSFGAGDWLDQADAEDTMSDTGGRWLSMQANIKTKVFLDKKHCMLDVATSMVNKVISLNDLWLGFERLGETQVRLTHHEVSRQGPANNLSIQPTTKLCFALKEKDAFDKAEKGSEKKKQKKNKKKKGKKSKKEESDKDWNWSASVYCMHDDGTTCCWLSTPLHNSIEAVCGTCLPCVPGGGGA
jgi:hypothetical protein